MNKLGQLTQQLVQLHEIKDRVLCSELSDSIRENNFLAFNTFGRDWVLIADAYFAKGATFPYHSHEKSKEILIVYKGLLDVTIEDDVVTLMPGEMIEIKKTLGHKVHAKEDTWAVFITLPSLLNI